MPQPKAFFNWSGGKDSALALYYALQKKELSIDRLLTYITTGNNRTTMHEVREALIEQQAQAIGLPLQKVLVPEQPSMRVYNQLVKETMRHLSAEGYTHSLYGDIFLEDLKLYREQQLRQAGISAVFPLWKKNSTFLVNEFIDLGFKAITVCINASSLPQEFAGRVIDREFLNDLPKNVDPCGENGEFHSFVFDGPIFSKPVQFSVEQVSYKDYAAPNANNQDKMASNGLMGFFFADLLPA